MKAAVVKRIKFWLFVKLWTGNVPCRTCGANEWHIFPGDEKCLRLRFTNRWLVSPVTGRKL